MLTRLILVAALGAVLVGACGGDAEETAAGGPDTERYCELTQQLDEAGETEIEVDFESATPDPEIIKTEFSDFVGAHGDKMDELERVAPTAIADDVAALNGTIRQVARTGELAAFEESSEAEGRIREFENRECSSD